MDKIVRLKDTKNFDFHFRKYWNSYVESDTPKLYFTLEEFLEKMNDMDFLRTAINKLEYQERIISCQYIKVGRLNHGFANFFLLRMPSKFSLCCESKYYYIYKHELNIVDDHSVQMFLPKRKVYNSFDIHPDSLDYLANFAIPINKKDHIYCLKCNKLIGYDELFNDNVIKISK